MKWFIGLLLITCFFILACTTAKRKTTSTPLPVVLPPSQADEVVNAAISKHGGLNYHAAAFYFDFRGVQYSFRNQVPAFEYTRQQEVEGQQIKDILTDKGFNRFVNEQAQTLTSADSTKYSNSLNSVIYFALLPYKLNDAAVIKTYKGITKIKNAPYHTIEVAFKAENGGTDHDDLYYYWFDQDTYVMGYFAYQFSVGEGGVRFRQAIQPKVIDGIRFQNYINFKAAKNTPLADLPRLFEAGELEQLSVIELENIRGMVK